MLFLRWIFMIVLWNHLLELCSRTLTTMEQWTVRLQNQFIIIIISLLLIPVYIMQL